MLTKKQKNGKFAYRYIKDIINNEINGKAKLQPLNGFFYKNITEYQQNIEFNKNAGFKDKKTFEFCNYFLKF